MVAEDEVQSTHWSHQQVKVFTAVAWMHDGCQSFAVISDDVNHDKIVRTLDKYRKWWNV